MILTPFAGNQAGTKPTFSRGYLNTGKVHFTKAPNIQPGHVTKSLCGRNLVAHDIYQASATDRLVETHRRISRTHVVHTCGRCVAKVGV